MSPPKNNTRLKARHQKLDKAMSKANLDALVLNPGPSLTYLTGLQLHLSERPSTVIFPCESIPVFVLGELEIEKTSGLDYESKIFTFGDDPQTWVDVFIKAVKAAGLSNGKIGIETRALRILELRLLEASLLDANFIPAEETIATLRMYKNEQVIKNMREAAKIAEQALQVSLSNAKVGMTERELSAEITLQLLRHNSDPELPFMPLVASGPNNSANPHAFPSSRQFTSGDLVVIDWGASNHGYYSDITRTYGVEKLNGELANIYQIVLDANKAAREITKPGITCDEVDKAAREVIEKAGYGKYFIHRTGHGLGMEVHEEPFIHAGNPMILEPSMTFTIEPGIYIPGKGGVRIEDDVFVTEDSLESFSKLPRGLTTIG